jgi:ACR3 family arsenite efflux pump ArsB
MMAKIAGLEGQLAAVPSQEVNELRIAELEHLLDEQEQKLASRSPLSWIKDIVLYLIVPLLLLLLAHWLITVVYDTKMIYLRIISMALPLPFAYFLLMLFFIFSLSYSE